MGPAHMQGLPKLPHCISDDHYIKMTRKIRRRKKKRKIGRRIMKRNQIKNRRQC